MKKKFPIICPQGSRVIITQGFKPANNPTHDACDFVILNDKLTDMENYRLTYGSQLVVTDDSECVLVNDFGSMNSLGNGIQYPFITGPANLKSYNTNLKANIKSINTNLIANVKSLNTNS